MPGLTPRKYALGTSVSAMKTEVEIRDLLTKAGATAFASASKEGMAMIQFTMRGRIIRFRLKLPVSANQDAETRRCWRVLLLTIKSKLEAVRDETVETFEEAFLAQTVPPTGGATMAEQMLPQLADAYHHGGPLVMRLELPYSGGSGR